MDSTPSEFEKLVRIENKDFFVDLKTNEYGRYVKIAERRNGNRNTVLVPVGGLEKLIDALNDAMDVVVADETDRKPSVGSKKKPIPGVPVPAPTVVAIPANEKCVFVSGFPKDTAEPDVVDFMRTAGVIFKVEMKGKGQFISAIVEYTTVQAAQKAVDQFNDTTYLGQVIKCRADRGSKIAAPRSAAVADDVPVVSKSERKAAAVAAKTAEPKELDELKVFCTNLTFDTTEQELIDHFAVAGTMQRAAINTTRKGRSLGTAIIEYVDAAMARNAIAQLNGTSLKGRELGVREFYK